MKRTISEHGGRIFHIHSLAVCFSLALILTLTWVQQTTPRSYASSKIQLLTFENRIAAQRAIEAVYHRHRIWPKDNPGPKPPLDKVMPESAICAQVEDYLRKVSALEVYWHRPITGEMLQAEIERMANQTKQPEMLGELWAALRNDPLVIAECLAQPALAERLSRKEYASDSRFHGALKQQAESALNQMRAGGRLDSTGGEYRELEWLLDDAGIAQTVRGQEINGTVYLDAADWQDRLRSLAETFGFAGATTEFSAGRWSDLREDEERFYAAAVLEKNDRRMKVASVVWRKAPFDQWWAGIQQGVSLGVQKDAFSYRLPPLVAAPVQCAAESWAATSISGAPATRNGHTSVWTGSEMIVWGGLDGISFFNSGGRYNPGLDTWAPISQENVPVARAGPTGVWTGAEMIVWGGNSSNSVTFSTGGRYNPATNSWRPTSNTGSPESRALGHTAVWTGTEMIIWGGLRLSPLSSLTSGGRYNPGSDSWRPTTTMNVPGTRIFHTAVWTGAEMIIWGGFTDTGGRYNPANDSWVATSVTNAPERRSSHSAVWSGTRMIIWGGSDRDTGGLYDPNTNSWTATSATNAPSPRREHTAVWTGTELIVWGGQVGTSPNNTPFNSGGHFNPDANSWRATSTTNAPGARYSQTAVWAGNQMIVWGGLMGGDPLTRLNTGGRYLLAGGLTISPVNQSFPAGGGNGTVSVTADGSCVWAATSNANWIAITAGGSGSGTGSVAFTVAANAGASPRTGTITITGQVFTVNQAGNDCHSATSITPASGIVGSNVTIMGTNFTSVSAVRFSNNVSAQFTVTSSTSITATVPAVAVTGPITISKPNCPDVQTGNFTVRPPNRPSQVASVTPNPVIAGGQNFTLTVNGSEFVSGSTLQWDGNDRPTTFINATRLTASIPATDIAMAREVKIRVFTPDGGGQSNELTLTVANAVTSVPAGSFSGTTLAPDSIVAAFGTKLATTMKSATTTPLPTELEGTTVKVADSAGAERLARLFFVAPMQINFLVPAETATGTATITVKSGDGTTSVGTATISPVAPNLFTANANGQGVAAGVALRVKAGGAQVYESIARFDATQNRFVPEPIDHSNVDDQVFLVLYGSGIRHRSALSAATCTIGELNHPVLFAGAIEGLFGLDQINVGPLSRILIGRGEVDVVLIVDGKQANLVRVSFK